MRAHSDLTSFREKRQALPTSLDLPTTIKTTRQQEILTVPGITTSHTPLPASPLSLIRMQRASSAGFLSVRQLSCILTLPTIV